MIRLHFQPGTTDQENNSGSGAFRDVHLCPKEIGDSCDSEGPHEGCEFLGWIDIGRAMLRSAKYPPYGMETFDEYQFSAVDGEPNDFPVRDAYTRPGGGHETQGALQDALGYASLIMEARKAGLRDDDTTDA